MPDNTLSTLAQIRNKVRRITRTPSEAQLSNANLDNYINTFLLYDFPEHLRLFSLRTTLDFPTQPYVDTYSGDEIDENFENKYINVYDNAYVAGYKQLFLQDRASFFGLYPKNEAIKSIGTGDGATANYTGTLSSIPVLRNRVTFTASYGENIGLAMKDVPNTPNDGTGVFEGDIGVPGTINYVTGAYNITFDNNVGNGETVYSQTVPYQAGRPTTMLYYNNEITFRPVPDKVYRVELEVGIRPTELLAAGTSPELSQWFQYIAYGAAKKIFEDRMDLENVQKIMPEFKMQQRLVNRRTIDQLSNERTATIYSQIGTKITDFNN